MMLVHGVIPRSKAMKNLKELRFFVSPRFVARLRRTA